MAVFDAVWIGGDTGNENDWATAANWYPANVPTANEVVLITGSVSIDGVTVPAACGGLYVQNYTGDLGSADSPITFATNFFTNDAVIEFNGQGQAYIDVGRGATTGLTNAPFITVYGSKAGDGTVPHGLYLRGSQVQRLTVFGGDVGVGVENQGSAMEVSDFVCNSLNGTPNVTLGEKVTITATTGNIDVFGGDVTLDMASQTIADINIRGGRVTKNCANTTTSLEMWAGAELVLNNGSVAGGNLYGGRIDLTQSTNNRVLVSTIYKGTTILYGGAPFNATMTLTPDTQESMQISYG